MTTRPVQRRPKTKGIQLVSSKLIYRGPAFSVYKDFVSEGKVTGQRDVVRHTGSVVIAALDDSIAPEPRLLLVRQYRYAADAYLWELPAGRVDSREKLLAGAQRELLEETGVRARKWKRMFRFYASPGFLDETMDVFLARGLRFGEAQPEDDEQIIMKLLPLRQAVKLALANRIRDAKTIATVLFLNTLRLSNS